VVVWLARTWVDCTWFLFSSAWAVINFTCGATRSFYPVVSTERRSFCFYIFITLSYISL